MAFGPLFKDRVIHKLVALCSCANAMKNQWTLVMSGIKGGAGYWEGRVYVKKKRKATKQYTIKQKYN